MSREVEVVSWKRGSKRLYAMEDTETHKRDPKFKPHLARSEKEAIEYWRKETGGSFRKIEPGKTPFEKAMGL